MILFSNFLNNLNAQVYAVPQAQNWVRGPPPFSGGPGGPPPQFARGPGGPPFSRCPGGPPPNFGSAPCRPKACPSVPPPVIDAGGCVTNPAANEALIRELYREVFSNKDVTNLNRYYVDDHIEHNPFDRDGIDQVRELVTTGTLSGPPVNVEIQRIISVGAFVWVHSKFPITVLNSTFAIVDIFRFECGKIREHWDVLQDTINLPGPVVSKHPFF